MIPFGSLSMHELVAAVIGFGKINEGRDNKGNVSSALFLLGIISTQEWYPCLLFDRQILYH